MQRLFKTFLISLIIFTTGCTVLVEHKYPPKEDIVPPVIVVESTPIIPPKPEVIKEVIYIDCTPISLKMDKSEYAEIDKEAYQQNEDILGYVKALEYNHGKFADLVKAYKNNKGNCKK